MKKILQAFGVILALIVVSNFTLNAQTLIDQWGLSAEYNTLWPILNDASTPAGNASMGADYVSGWKGLQGGFGQDITISTDQAIVVKGKIQFVGASAGAAYTALRYALTYQDSNSTLVNALTDSATWSHRGNHFGYEFTPRTGAGTMANGGGGAGTVWTINNGNWASTWSNNGRPIIAVNQAPRNAEMIASTYDIAISVHSIDDITNEIRWYMVEEDNKYWFGGTVQDTSTTKKFNSIIFGINEVEWTQFDVIALEVDKGDPIEVPKAPWEDFYVDTWGIYGGNDGGWNLTPGEFTGNVDFTGTAASTDWSVVRGDLGLINPEPDVDIFVLKGKIVLEGGGFESSSSLRFGLFQGDNAGSLDSLENGYNWNGTDDANSGYLVLAQEGSNNTETWGTGVGNWGKISNDIWHNFAGGTSLGDIAPLQSTGGAGTYNFAICVAPKGDGTSTVLWTLQKGDGSYYMEGGAIDNAPIEKFNSFVVGVGSGASATSMFLKDVEATMTDELIPTDVEDLNTERGLPTEFALGQNYPNPFNPATTIEFALPKDSDVKLVVYDILGGEVAQLVKGDLKAGYHQINFNAANLASGVYFYAIKAGDFVSVKKLVLLK
ncbi:MAG: T9SS type A sorting domain-containing protein [Ignavibacteriae bacterium]|nr:T9SS type A sorting domain-containing protein [Ignavibacteriota bacterium]